MLKNAFTVMFSCFVAVLAIELLCRLLYPAYLTGGYIGAYQYDETLGTRLKPNIHWFKTTDYQQEFYTNRIGTVNFQQYFDGYPVLIFALGDSYTQGTGLPGDANYPFQLGLILNMPHTEYLHKYAVVNLGIAAFGGEQALLTLSMYTAMLGKPQYILYLGCSNDYMDDVLFKNGYRHRHLVDGNPHYWSMFLKPLQWFRHKTEIGKRVMIALGALKQKSYLGNDMDERGTEANANIAALEEPVLNRLFAVSQELHALLIVSWSDLEDNSRSYQWLKEWARAKNVAFADWHPLVASVRQAMPELPITNHHSGGHYRTWINTMIARAFAEHIHQ